VLQALSSGSRCPARALAVVGVLACLWLLALSGAARVDAAIVPAAVLDGPSASVLDVDGAALASDGTGGVVFRELVRGEPHVLVARFLNGVWQAPQQADVGQLGPATSPRVAAGDGGELLVAWVQPWQWISGTLHYALMSAVLQPGAQSFGQIERIADVGATATAYPSLAMAPNGAAYVVYLDAGDVRVARFNGLSWSSVGVINGLPGQVALRTPTASNAPVIAVNDRGQALVVWQEPTIEGPARIWARRIFGATKGDVLAVSPSSIDGRPVTVDADAPAIALNEYGQAEIAFRLEGGAGSPLGTPHVMIDTLPQPVAEAVSSFTGSVALDGAATIGPPSVAVDRHNEFRVAYTAAGATRLLVGAENASGAPVAKGGPAALGPASAEEALVTLAPDGGGVTAWPSVDAAGLPVVEAREDFPDGAWQTADLSAPLSGPLSDLVGAESGSGDVLLAFLQGPPGSAQVMASFAQTPPESFSARVPSGWIRASAATVSWEAAPDAIGDVSYSVLVDGRVVAQGLTGLSDQLDPRALGDGTRRIQVLATDELGQQTLSNPTSLQVESNPPQVAVRRLGGDRVEVRVDDDPAGIEPGRTLVSFGDGSTSRGRDSVIHAYSRPGRYTIVVHATDKVGNARDAYVRVEIG
jgi:hypothetical protein